MRKLYLLLILLMSSCIDHKVIKEECVFVEDNVIYLDRLPEELPALRYLSYHDGQLFLPFFVDLEMDIYSIERDEKKTKNLPDKYGFPDYFEIINSGKFMSAYQATNYVILLDPETLAEKKKLFQLNTGVHPHRNEGPYLFEGKNGYTYLAYHIGEQNDPVFGMFEQNRLDSTILFTKLELENTLKSTNNQGTPVAVGMNNDEEYYRIGYPQDPYIYELNLNSKELRKREIPSPFSDNIDISKLSVSALEDAEFCLYMQSDRQGNILKSIRELPKDDHRIEFDFYNCPWRLQVIQEDYKKEQIVHFQSKKYIPYVAISLPDKKYGLVSYPDDNGQSYIAVGHIEKKRKID
ncbi:MAG: hypothetical protein AAGC47_12115 [Bacteroidota bacterium]